MRSRFSTKALRELKAESKRYELSKAPAIRIITPIKNGLLKVIDIFHNPQGTVANRTEYETMEKPGTPAGLTIINDLGTESEE